MIPESGLCMLWNKHIDILTSAISCVRIKNICSHKERKGKIDMDWTFTDILDAFKDYIAGSEYIDVCHTKFGYIILHYNPGTEDFAYMPEIIETPEDLLQNLKEEIVMDVLEGTEHDLEDATEEELKEIAELTEKYMTILHNLKPSA